MREINVPAGTRLSPVAMAQAERVIVGGIVVKDRHDNRNLGKIMRYENRPQLVRGAKAIATYLNQYLAGGKPLTAFAVYRMVESGALPVRRLGKKRAEIWANTADLDRLFNPDS